MERLIFSADDRELLRQQGVAQALIGVLGLPEGLEEEIVAERYRAAMRTLAGSSPGNQHLPLATDPEPY